MSEMTTDLRIARLEDLSLVDDPFKLNADPRYLYLGEDHLKAYRRMQSVVTSKRGLAVVTGAPGVGKSSLARRVFDSFYGSADVIISYIPLANFSSKMEAARAISAALPELEVPQKHTYSQQLEALQTGVTQANKANKNVVIILDDAQMIARGAMVVLHALYNFEYHEKAVQTLVFGQEEVMQLFKRYPALNSRIYNRSNLEPLTLGSTIKMISYRLQAAGRKEPLFDDAAFTRIYDLSSGLPREIVRLCSMALDYLLENNQAFVSQPVIRAIEVDYDRRIQ